MTIDKPLSQLNKFFELASEKTLSGSDQLIYLHLFNKFNRAHWTETILVNDAELKKLINWYESNGKPASDDTIRRAKQRLKKKGFIEFVTGKGADTTEYKLIKLYPADTPATTPAYTPAYTPPSSNYAHAKDEEDAKDGKTDFTTDITARAKPNEAEKPKGIRSVLSENSEEVKQAWLECEGERLKGGVALGLIQLEKNYGAEVVIDAIYKAHQANNQPRLSFNFVKAVLERILKGGEKANGKIVPIRGTADADSTDRTWDKRVADWLKD